MWKIQGNVKKKWLEGKLFCICTYFWSNDMKHNSQRILKVCGIFWGNMHRLSHEMIL